MQLFTEYDPVDEYASQSGRVRVGESQGSRRKTNGRAQVLKDLVGTQSHEEDIARENRSELHSVTRSWCVIEIAISGVNSVVAEIVENHQVAWNGVFWANFDTKAGLASHAVGKLDTKLRKYKHGVARAVKSLWC